MVVTTLRVQTCMVQCHLAYLDKHSRDPKQGTQLYSFMRHSLTLTLVGQCSPRIVLPSYCLVSLRKCQQRRDLYFVCIAHSTGVAKCWSFWEFHVDFGGISELP